MEKQVGINNIKQLFNINKENTNFSATFSVSSAEKKPFYIAVVNQTNIDNDEIQFKIVNDGTISGNVKSDKNIKDDYYIALKSDENNIVNIKTTLEPLPMQDLNYEPTQPSSQPSSQPTGQVQPSQPAGPVASTQPQGFFGDHNKIIKYLLIVLVGLIIGYIIYKFILSRKIKAEPVSDSSFTFTEELY